MNEKPGVVQVTKKGKDVARKHHKINHKKKIDYKPQESFLKKAN